MVLRVVAAGAVVVLSLANAAAQEASAPAGNAAQGKQVFMTDGCFQCHGTVGQGSRATGPRIARTELPYAAFVNQLRNPANEMPPYEAKILSDGDVANIFAYLQSQPTPAAVKDIPLLNK